MIKYAELESKRFNANVFRANVDDFNIENLKEEILSNNVDILILRIPSNSKANHFNLLKLGFEVIHADTLVYYSANINSLKKLSLNNNLTFEIITEKNRNILVEIIPIIFSDYQNHYSSNYKLNKDKIKEGYIEWALSYIQAEDKISWVVKENETVVGFATCLIDDDSKIAEGILYGVLPEHSGKGIYSDIIKFTMSFFSNKGFNKMKVSTQIQNYAVQKSWINNGFKIEKSFETYHLNIFLNKTLWQYEAIEFNFDILELINLTKLKIENDLETIIQLQCLKVLKLNFPNQNIDIISFNFQLIKPIESKQKYYCKFNLININEKNEEKEVKFIFKDSNEEICIISNCTFLNN